MEQMQAVSDNREIKSPPHADGFPILGSLPNFIQKQTNYFFEAWQQHGDIYTLSMGTFEFIVLNHPDFAQHVLRDNARNYSKDGVMWDAARTLVGNGLATSEGDYWRRQRRLIQPAFHRQYLASITNLMADAIDEVIQNWDELASSGKDLEVSELFAQVTMNVIMRTIFGRGISAEETKQIGKAFSFALQYIPQEMVTGRIPDWLPVPKRKQYHEALETIDKFVFRIINERRNNPSDSLDIASMLLGMVDDETNLPMSDKEIRDEVATIFLAGYETTSLAMAWGTFALSQEPAIQEKLWAHVDTVLGGRRCTFEDLGKLDYSRMVISEIMRLYPSAFWFPRTAIEDDEIAGYKIKKGQILAIIPLTIHRHPDFWTNPLEFNPERFHTVAEKVRHPLAWMPFGAGQRQCIGKDFAMMESTLILSRLVQRYRFRTSQKPAPEFAFSGTLSSRDGIRIKLEKR